MAIHTSPAFEATYHAPNPPLQQVIPSAAPTRRSWSIGDVMLDEFVLARCSGSRRKRLFPSWRLPAGVLPPEARPTSQPTSPALGALAAFGGITGDDDAGTAFTGCSIHG